MTSQSVLPTTSTSDEPTPSTAEMHEKMMASHTAGLGGGPTKLEINNARLIKEGEEIMALHRAEEATRREKSLWNRALQIFRR